MAVLALVGTALVSLACMFWVGQRNRSVLLMLMFALWVTSPFLGLAGLERRAVAAGEKARLTWHTVLAAVVGISLIVYPVVALGIPMRKPAAPFLLLPLVSWVAISILYVRIRPAGSH